MKLFAKLMLCMVLVVMVAVAIVTLFSIRERTEVLSSELISGKQQIAAQIANATKNAFQTASLLFMERMLKDVGAARDIVFCRIVKPDDTIYLADKRQDYGADMDPEIANATEPLLDYVFATTGERGKIIIEPVELGGETWKVVLGVSLKSIEHANRAVIKRGVYLALVITGFTTLIAFALSRRLTSPIARLAHATEKVAAGDLEYSAKVSSTKDEVGALAESFNMMIGSLRISQEKLKSYSQSLEEEIAERERAEEALQRISNEQSVLLSTVPAMIFWIGKEGNFIRVNEAFAAALHKSADDIEGKSLFDLYPEDMARKFHNDNLEVMNFDTPKRHIEEPVETPRGIMWVSTDKIPYRDQNGEVMGIIGFSVDITQRKQVEEVLQKAHDELETRVEERTIELKAANKQLQQEVTERKQAEKALRESEEKYRLIFENAEEGISVHEEFPDGSRKLMDCNPQYVEMSGYSREELMRIGDTQKIHEDYRPAEQRDAAVEKARAGQSYSGIFSWRRPDGKENYVEYTAAPLNIGGRKLTIGIDRDITERRRAEEALQYQLEVEERITRELAEKTEELSRINEELDAFVYNVSHDLKSPVVSLQGFSSLLMKEYEDGLDEDGKMYIDRIQKNSERMGILIDNLLELSRIGRVKGEEELVDISDVISDVADELAPQLEERGTRLMVKGEMPTVKCDRTRMGQIFVNLISNASKFMGKDNQDPTIEVGYDDGGGYHTFYVKDNGIGINGEYREKIFQIFQRLEDIETEGTGVGLAIVKKIVENFGGEIWVDSAKGKGTTMYFTMPKGQRAKS